MFLRDVQRNSLTVEAFIELLISEHVFYKTIEHKSKCKMRTNMPILYTSSWMIWPIYLCFEQSGVYIVMLPTRLRSLDFVEYATCFPKWYTGSGFARC